MTPTARAAAVVLAALLAGCSSKPYPPERGASSASAAVAPAEATSAAVAASAAAPAASGQSSTWTSTYPYGTDQGAVAPAQSAAAAPQPAPAPSSAEPAATAPSATAPSAAEPSPGGELLARASDSGETVTVYSSEDESGERSPLAPFVSGWSKPGSSADQHRADIEACYRYAWSQVEHDIRIESDVAAARDDADKGLGFTQLTQRMNLYDHKERRTELINDCMETKGYVQR